MASVDYASVLEISSFPAAVVFAILYFPFLLFYLSKVILRPTYVYVVLTLFCAIRVSAFILRALLSRVPSVADNLAVLIAYEVLYNTGFFGLLYSTYILVNARIDVTANPPANPISRIIHRRILFRIFMLAAVSLGIAGVDLLTSANPSDVKVGNVLRQVAIYIFLVGVVLVLLQTVFLAIAESSGRSYHAFTSRIGATYGVYVLFVIALLLLVREVFFAATSQDAIKQNNEAFWYPFAVVTEFLAVALFAVPSLLPDAPKEA